MSWDESYVRAQVKNEWESPLQLWVLPYYTKRSGNADGVSEFIWNFKDGKSTAVPLAIDLLVKAVAQEEEEIRNTFRCSFICSVPSSQKGCASPVAERVCCELAKKFPWLTHLAGALRRTQTVPRAHLCSPGNRPTLQKHLDTITYRDNYNLKGQNVLLFDDILTTGNTSDACTLTLQSGAHCGNVVGIFLGKTQ